MIVKKKKSFISRLGGYGRETVKLGQNFGKVQAEKAEEFRGKFRKSKRGKEVQHSFQKGGSFLLAPEPQVKRVRVPVKKKRKYKYKKVRLYKKGKEGKYNNFAGWGYN